MAHMTSDMVGVRRVLRKTCLMRLACFKRSATAAAMFVLFSAPGAFAHPQHGSSPPVAAEDAESARVKQTLRDYVRDDPERVKELLAELNKHDEAARAAKLKELLPEIESAEGGFAIGAPASKAKVTVVDLFDYHCPSCKRATADIFKLVKEHDQVRFVFKEYPVLRKDSRLPARAALAARSQGKYVKMHAALMAAPGVLSERRVYEIAEAAGVNVAKLKAAMTAPSLDEEIDRNIALGEALDLNAAPIFFVNGQILPGRDLTQLTKMIDSALGAAP